MQFVYRNADPGSIHDDTQTRVNSILMHDPFELKKIAGYHNKITWYHDLYNHCTMITIEGCDSTQALVELYFKLRLHLVIDKEADVPAYILVPYASLQEDWDTDVAKAEQKAICSIRERMGAELLQREFDLFLFTGFSVNLVINPISPLATAFNYEHVHTFVECMGEILGDEHMLSANPKTVRKQIDGKSHIVTRCIFGCGANPITIGFHQKSDLEHVCREWVRRTGVNTDDLCIRISIKSAIVHLYTLNLDNTKTP